VFIVRRLNCIIRHLVSSHSVGGRTVHRLRTGRTSTGVMIPDAVPYNFDLLMTSTYCSKHVEAFNKFIIKQAFVH